MTRPLPAYIARCPGVGDWEDGAWDWREGCEDCRRRTSRGQSEVPPIVPEGIVVFECPWRIAPNE
jgi:hypothetical protein